LLGRVPRLEQTARSAEREEESYMFVILALLTLVLLILIFSNIYGCWRKAALSAAVVWGVFITVITEGLSYLKLLGFFPVLFCWSLVTLGLIGFYYYSNRQKKLTFQFPYIEKIFFYDLSPFLSILIGSIVTITAIVGAIAILAPPNTWDSMTYHMSRVVHWIQNHSVAFYPTYNLPQLFHPPFAEFAIMQFQILSGSDRFANLVQWFSAIGSIVGVSLIAKELNANLRGQVFAAVFCATIPMGILQASSTQNDYAVAFWLVCLTYFILQVINTKSQLDILFFIGASLGLAILTKSSGYLYAFPFMVWFSLNEFIQKRWESWKAICLSTLIAFLINFNHYLRNLDLFNSPIPSPENFARAYKIEIFSLPTFVSNVVRNLALHLDIVRNLGLERWITPITGIANKLLLMFHAAIGVDMYDPRITADSYSGVPGISFDENTAGNPLHFFLLCGLFSYFIFRKKLRSNRLILVYILAVVSGFLLLCLSLKIQVYQPRHHLSIFILFAPFVGICLGEIAPSKLANGIAILLIFACLPWVFNNKFRPIIGEENIFNLSRVEQYFMNRSQLEQPYMQATNFVLSQGCSNVGLSLGRGITVGNEYWEYPFWVLFNDQNKQVRLENIKPENVSSIKANNPPFNNFNPCAIVAVRTGKDKPITEMVVKDEMYVEKLSVPPVSVLIKE
jgi:4-amino-4-deoxy-L-arabinose transferase-like glycosyltransferase